MRNVEIKTLKDLEFACNRHQDQDARELFVYTFWDLFCAGLPYIMILSDEEYEEYVNFINEGGENND